MPAFFTGNRELGFAFDGGGEGIYLSRVSKLVRHCVGFHDGSAAT